MTIFGKPKRKQTSPEASRKNKAIYRNKDNNNSYIRSKNAITEKAKSKDRVFQGQTSLNLAQPPPPYSSTAPLQPNCRPSPPIPYQYQYQYPPARNPVSQVHLLGRPSPPSHGMYTHGVKGHSCTNLSATSPAQCVSHGLDAWHDHNTDSRNPGAGLCDLISSKLNTVLTLIDGERFSGDERELGMPLWFGRNLGYGLTYK